MLKIRGKRKEILKAMQDAAKVIPGKTTMEILNNLLLEANDGELRIRGTNLDTTIEIAVEVEVFEAGSMLVSAKNTIEFISKVYSDEISLTHKSNNVLTIGYDLSEANLRAADAEQYPNLPIVERQEGNSIIMKAVDFRDMAEKVSKAVATDGTRPILAGVLLDIKGNDFTMVALDGFRLIKADKALEGVTMKKKIIVPGKALQNVTKLIGNDKEAEIEVIASDNHVEIGYMNVKLITRLLEGEFVNYGQIIPNVSNMPISIKVNSGQTREVADRVSLLAEQNDERIIELQLSGNSLKISGQSNYGSAEEEITVSEAKGEIKICINNKYLQDSLEAFVGECTIYMSNEVSPIIIGCPTGDTTALLLPVRKKSVAQVAQKAA